MAVVPRIVASAVLLVACQPKDGPAPVTAGTVATRPETPSQPKVAASDSASRIAAASAIAVAPNAPPTTSFRGEIDPRFVPDLKAAFAAYKGWGRVDDELRFAPWLCRMPEPGVAHISAADHGAHGRKLYSLFAKDRGSYLSLGRDDLEPQGQNPTLQAVVKESYLPEPVTEPPPPRGVGRGASESGLLGAGDHFWPYARGEGGAFVRAGAVAGLFVVLEKPPGTPGTDDGFVYGTMTPTGEITSAGKVGPCVACHEKAQHRRLFGTTAIH
jgi:hypothetical protein